MTAIRSPRTELVEALLDALSVIAPTECSGCGLHDRALCAACRARLAPHPQVITLDAGSGSWPLAVYSALEYEGVASRVLVAFKDGARTDASGALAVPLRAAIVAALRAGRRSRVRLAVIPSSRAAFRRRGYSPIELVLRSAGLTPTRHLLAVRQTRDQATLSADDRAENRHGSLRAKPAVRGHQYLIVDDIVTTGATLVEAKRALEAHGAEVAGGATIAFTRKRNAGAGHSGDPGSLPDDFSDGRVYGR